MTMTETKTEPVPFHKQVVSGDLMRILLDPVHWARHALEWTVLPHQAKALRGSKKQTLVYGARRTGRTETAVVSALHKVFVGPPLGKERRIILIAVPSDYMRCRMYQLVSMAIGQTPLLSDMVSSYHDSARIEFKDGSIIYFAFFGSGSTDMLRAFRGLGLTDIYFDDYPSSEAAVQEAVRTLNDPDVNLWVNFTTDVSDANKAVHHWEHD